MRKAITPAVLGLLSTAAMTCHGAAPAPGPSFVVQPRAVHLNGPRDLERLRETNFYHYLRAKKILAAANELCRPKPEQIYRVRFSDADPQCGAMWMTSFPPKKLLRFHLDDVFYVALVTVTDLRGKLLPVDHPTH
jgi:hypothetical protein